MRVLFLQQQPCIRALKYAAGLRARSPQIRLAFAYEGRTLGEWYGSGDELFERWFRLDGRPAEELRRAIEEFRPDVVHSHNLPDSLTVLAHEVAGGVPVVHDVHDLQSLRHTPYENGFPQPDHPLDLERGAVEESDAVVAVSDEQLHEIRARYDVGSKTLVFPNYALARDIPEKLPQRDGRRNGIPPRLVYQGTLSTNGGHYDLREIFRTIASDSVRLDVFPGRPAPAYAELARELPRLRFHESLPPAALLRELPAYDVGWAGFDTSLNGAHLDTALPNKLFEYLGCGLPVLTLGHRALARFVEERGVGASLPSADRLGEQIEALDLPALRGRIAEVRHELTVEANVHRLVELYEAVA